MVRLHFIPPSEQTCAEIRKGNFAGHLSTCYIFNQLRVRQHMVDTAFLSETVFR